MSPFFSIGITTYNRRLMLKQTLNSILKQRYKDFEILVSNDNPQREISAQILGIKDRRIQYINQKKNLGEIKNMNFLLEQSKGKYFTWLADDDCYHQDFLKIISQAIKKYQHPPCVFSSYLKGNNFKKQKKIKKAKIVCLNSKLFLDKYLKLSFRTLGCYGVFKKNYLKQIGGIKQLGSGFSPYSDNLLALQCSKLDKVITITEPMIYYRTHKGSISLTSTDFLAYLTAQKDFFCHALKIFNHPNLRDNCQEYIFLVLKWFIRDFTGLLKRTRRLPLKDTAKFIGDLHYYSRVFKKRIIYWSLMGFLIKKIYLMILIKSTNKFKFLSN